MQNNFFDLDQVFELVKLGDFWGQFGGQVVQSFPDLSNTMSAYQNTLLRLLNAPITLPTATSEVYGRIINFSDFGHYHLFWNIPKALSVIKNRHIQLIDIPVHDLIKTVDVDNLNLEKLESPNFQPHPVIVAKFPMIPEQYITIDGNHTVYWAHRHGYHGIKGYLMQIEDHIEAMSSDLFRTLFAIHANISGIGFFMTTPNATLNDIVLYPIPYEL